MDRQYGITGITCQACVVKVQSALKTKSVIDSVEIHDDFSGIRIRSASTLNLDELNQRLQKVGDYTITKYPIKKELSPFPEIKKKVEITPKKSIGTYSPLILIVSFITGVCVLVQYPFQEFAFDLWMRHFMAGFFIVFSFFKLLNIKGFADSYRMYDIIAARWKGWGYIYPFIELALGIAFLINFNPFLTNVSTIFVLGVSSIGVIESNINKRKIKCACLGDVFNLPMSTVTIVEDLTMVVMAAVMLIM